MITLFAHLAFVMMLKNARKPIRIALIAIITLHPSAISAMKAIIRTLTVSASQLLHVHGLRVVFHAVSTSHTVAMSVRTIYLLLLLETSVNASHNPVLVALAKTKFVPNMLAHVLKSINAWLLIIALVVLQLITESARSALRTILQPMMANHVFLLPNARRM